MYEKRNVANWTFRNHSSRRPPVEYVPSIRSGPDGMTGTFTWAPRGTTSWRARCSAASPRWSLATDVNCGDWQPIRTTSYTLPQGMTSTWPCGARTSSSGPFKQVMSAWHWHSIPSAPWPPEAPKVTCLSSTAKMGQSCWPWGYAGRPLIAWLTTRVRYQG